MIFKKTTSKAEWEKIKGNAAKQFAEIWGNEMERLMNENEDSSLENIAFEAFKTSLDKQRINGAEEYAAVGLLGQYWYKGNELYQLWTDGSIMPH